MMVHKPFLKANKNEIYATIIIENQALLLNTSVENNFMSNRIIEACYQIFNQWWHLYNCFCFTTNLIILCEYEGDKPD